MGRNSTVTTSIRSPSKKSKYKHRRNKFNKKVCLFDGLCNVDYPEFELIRFNKIKKTIDKKTVYQFQSKYNYYLDLDTIDYHQNNGKVDERVFNKNVSLCRSDESYQQLFQPAIYEQQDDEDANLQKPEL